MIYKRCGSCGRKIPADCICPCKKDRQRQYKKLRMKDVYEKERQRFYASKPWIKCRDDVKCHQFGIDLIEWFKGNDDVSSETYHHIITIKEDWSLRLCKDNIIGLSQKNHLLVHKLMEESEEKKIEVQNYLKNILEEFEKNFY